jgi:hypothetical protein
MKKVLKTKKVLRRLGRVEVLLSKVIGQYAADERGIRKMLESARASVKRATAKAKPLAGKGKSATTTKAPVAAKTSRKTKSRGSGGTAKELRLKARRGTPKTSGVMRQRKVRGKASDVSMPRNSVQRSQNVPSVESSTAGDVVPLVTTV